MRGRGLKRAIDNGDGTYSVGRPPCGGVD